MNIYKTKSRLFINMDNVSSIETEEDVSPHILTVKISMTNNDKHVFYGDEAKSFLDYLNKRLNGVFEGYA